MFTFSLLYVIIYLFVFLALLNFVFARVPLAFLANSSLNNCVLYIQRYIPEKNLFFFLVFSLTGLPPVGLFFVKFNILTFILYQTHFFIIISLFFFFFLNMLYYMQIFNFRNFKKNCYHSFKPGLFFTNSSNTTSRISTYNTYSSNLFVVNVLIGVFLVILVFGDFFILVNFLKCQQ